MMAIISRVVATGRMMKGWEMFINKAFAWRHRLVCGLHPATLPQPFRAVRDHQLAGFKPFRHGGVAPLAYADGDRPQLHRFVGLDHIDEGSLGTALDGGGRDDDG